MKKLLAIIGLVVVAFIAQAQTNVTSAAPGPTHNVESDLSYLIQDIFPNMSKEDYALLLFAIHLGARYLRNYKLKDSTKESGLLSNLVAHLAANPLPEAEQPSLSPEIPSTPTTSFPK